MVAVGYALLSSPHRPHKHTPVNHHHPTPHTSRPKGNTTLLNDLKPGQKLHGGVVGVTDFAAFLDVQVVRKGAGGRVSGRRGHGRFCVSHGRGITSILDPIHPPFESVLSPLLDRPQLVRCNAMLHPHDVPEGVKLLRDGHPLPLEADPSVIRRGEHVQVRWMYHCVVWIASPRLASRLDRQSDPPPHTPSALRCL